MIAPVPPGYRGRVLELGTGTGVLTVPLAQRCPQARILACEINPELAEVTRQNLVRAGINGQVQLRAHAAQHLLADVLTQPEDRPGYVISGLPIGNLPRQAVLDLLHTIRRVLPNKGFFVQAQHFLVDRKHVRAVFGNLRILPVLRNLPPLFVYYAQK